MPEELWIDEKIQAKGVEMYLQRLKGTDGRVWFCDAGPRDSIISNDNNSNMTNGVTFSSMGSRVGEDDRESIDGSIAIKPDNQ